MNILKIIPKWLLLLILVLGVVTIVILIVIVSGGGAVAVNPGIEPDPTDEPRTSLQTPDDSRVFDYVAITNEDTLVFVDENGDEIFTNLERKNWKDIRWSPGGNLVSVLGVTATKEEEKIYDLFIYNFPLKEWKQITFFQDATIGISGYEWMDNDHVAFTQGPTGQIWLHDYDYPNAELLKIFQVEGELIQYIDDKDQFIIQSEGTLNLINFGQGTVPDNTFSIYSSEGILVKSLNGFVESGTGLRLNSIIIGRSSEEFIFTGQNFVNDTSGIYLWSFGNPSLVRSSDIKEPFGSLTLFCRKDRNLMFAASNTQDEAIWGSFNPDTGTFASSGKLPLSGDFSRQSFPKYSFLCDSEPQFLQVMTLTNGQPQLEAFQLKGSGFVRVFFKNIFVEIDTKSLVS